METYFYQIFGGTNPNFLKLIEREIRQQSESASQYCTEKKGLPGIRTTFDLGDLKLEMVEISRKPDNLFEAIALQFIGNYDLQQESGRLKRLVQSFFGDKSNDLGDLIVDTVNGNRNFAVEVNNRIKNPEKKKICDLETTENYLQRFKQGTVYASYESMTVIAYLENFAFFVINDQGKLIYLSPSHSYASKWKKQTYKRERRYVFLFHAWTEINEAGHAENYFARIINMQ